MKISEPKLLAALPELGVEVRSGSALADMTSLAIGGTTDLLRLKRNETIPAVLHLLEEHGIPHRFLGGGTNLLVQDGELPWVVLQLVGQDPEVRLDGNFASVDAAADLGRTVTFCAKNNLGGMEGLIGVPGTVGGALRMNAGAYGMQIGTYVREITLYRAADCRIETLCGDQISFEYRHTSFAPDDIMLAVKLELPSKPFKEILQGIRICNEKRRAQDAAAPVGIKLVHDRLPANHVIAKDFNLFRSRKQHARRIEQEFSANIGDGDSRAARQSHNEQSAIEKPGASRKFLAANLNRLLTPQISRFVVGVQLCLVDSFQ